MRVKKVISKSRDGNRMEVVAEDGGTLRTLHIHWASGDNWRYYAGLDEDNKPIFKPITV